MKSIGERITHILQKLDRLGADDADTRARVQAVQRQLKGVQEVAAEMEHQKGGE